jgi:hypothetical protein
VEFFAKSLVVLCVVLGLVIFIRELLFEQKSGKAARGNMKTKLFIFNKLFKKPKFSNQN